MKKKTIVVLMTIITILGGLLLQREAAAKTYPEVPWLAGSYGSVNTMPDMALNISMGTIDLSHSKTIGSFRINVMNGDEDKGIIKRCKNKKKFKLVGNDKKFKAYIYVLDDTFGKIKLKYKEGSFVCRFDMYETFCP